MREGTPVPFVSVIVPVFGAARTLEASLRSIAESAYPSFEIVAADDGSTDASRGLLESFGVRIVRLDHSGPAAARNRAVAIARGDVLFFTDADVVIRPDTIARGVAALTADPEIAAVFGSYTAESGPGGFFTHYKNYVHHFTHQHAEPDAFTFWTGCGFVRRRVFEAHGGFDESQRFLSDVEFGYRLHGAGERIRIQKDIQVTHLKQYTFMGLVRSDFFGRAVPWSRLIMRHKTARADMNLGLRNVASVPIAFATLGGLCLWPWSGTWGMLLSAVGFLVLAFLNARLLSFVREREGAAFALGTLLVHWIIYLLSGIGVLAATLGFRSGGR